MARRSISAEEVFDDVASDNRWSRVKQIDILLGFIDQQDLANELDEYLRQVSEDDDVEESDELSFPDEE